MEKAAAHTSTRGISDLLKNGNPMKRKVTLE
jgi:hypothetical protein